MCIGNGRVVVTRGLCGAIVFAVEKVKLKYMSY